MEKTIYSEPYRQLIAKLKAARLTRGLTQTQAGQIVGFSRNWISKVENCEIRLDVLAFVRLCSVYRASPEELIQRLNQEDRR